MALSVAPSHSMFNGFSKVQKRDLLFQSASEKRSRVLRGAVVARGHASKWVFHLELRVSVSSAGCSTSLTVFEAIAYL